MQRRTFVKSGAVAVAASSTAFAAANRVLGANDKIRCAVLGLNGRGKSHFNGLQPLENVEVTTFVDPDLEIARQRAGEFEAKYGHRPKVVQDMRRVLDDKDIDVVTIATPNHWHTLAAIWACQAGKDVYIEKPATHCFNEGKSLIAAAHKYDRIVQHGVQLRSSDAIREAVAKMREGLIGDVYMARATIFKWRPRLEQHPDETRPRTSTTTCGSAPANGVPTRSAMCTTTGTGPGTTATAKSATRAFTRPTCCNGASTSACRQS